MGQEEARDGGAASGSAFGGKQSGSDRWGASYWTQLCILFTRSVRNRRFDSLSIQDIVQFALVGVLCGKQYCFVFLLLESLLRPALSHAARSLPCLLILLRRLPSLASADVLCIPCGTVCSVRYNLFSIAALEFASG